MAISSALGSSALLPAGLGFRNTVINGHMRIAQRGSTAVSTNDTFPVDRWKVSTATSGAWTSQQIPSSTTATPAGFDYSLNFTKTIGGTAAAGDYNYFVHAIEGNNCAFFDWGTSNAKTLTLSFWVRSGATGTFGGSLRNSAANYAYCFTYTVNAINTWEYKTIQIPGVTAGTWAKDTSAGIVLFFDLGSGANARGTAGIATGNYVGTTGTSLYPNNTTGGYINFTGVQLEQNLQPTPFEQRPIGVELALCQRYYEKFSATAVYSVYAQGYAGATDNIIGVAPFRVTKRVHPHTLDIVGSCIISDNATSTAIYTLQLWTIGSIHAGGVLATAPATLTVGKGYMIISNNNTTSSLAFSSEL